MSSYSVDPELSAAAIAKANESHEFRATLLTWTAVHGNLQLALRHPMNIGASRTMVETFVKDLGVWLVERGLLTAEVLAEADRREGGVQRLVSLQGPERK